MEPRARQDREVAAYGARLTVVRLGDTAEVTSIGSYLGVAVAVCAGVLTATGFAALAARMWRRSLGRFHHARTKVRSLAAGCTADYFTAVLGPPTTRRTVGDADGLVEQLWLDPLFHVQGIINEDDTVVRWAVTLRHHRLRLEFQLPPSGEPNATVILGRTAFAAVDVTSVNNIEAFLGARRWHYVERIYFGNPGRYQPFWLATNDSVIVGANVSVADVAAVQADHKGEDSAEVKGWWQDGPGLDAVDGYRAAASPNTYSEAVPGHDEDPYPIGPDRDHVRLVIR